MTASTIETPGLDTGKSLSRPGPAPALPKRDRAGRALALAIEAHIQIGEVLAVMHAELARKERQRTDTGCGEGCDDLYCATAVAQAARRGFHSIAGGVS